MCPVLTNKSFHPGPSPGPSIAPNVDSHSRAIPRSSTAAAPATQPVHAPPNHPIVANPAPLQSVVTPTELPLPPTAPTAPKETTQRYTEALTSMKPLAQYSTAVLHKAISCHLTDLTNTTADQLVTQQAIATSLSHLRQLQGRIASLEDAFKREPTGTENSKSLATQLESTHIIRKKERDRIVELRAIEHRNNFNIGASRIDIQKMEGEIQCRKIPAPRMESNNNSCQTSDKAMP